MSRTLVLLTVAASVSCHGTRAPKPPPTVARSERETVVEMFARSYVPGRSGQIFVVAEKGNYFLERPDDVYRFMHGSPWEYDVEIPILFYGEPFVRKGEYPGPAHQQDVAPTLASILGLPPPTIPSRAPDIPRSPPEPIRVSTESTRTPRSTAGREKKTSLFPG